MVISEGIEPESRLARKDRTRRPERRQTVVRGMEPNKPIAGRRSSSTEVRSALQVTPRHWQTDVEFFQESSFVVYGVRERKAKSTSLSFSGSPSRRRGRRRRWRIKSIVSFAPAKW